MPQSNAPEGAMPQKVPPFFSVRSFSTLYNPLLQRIMESSYDEMIDQTRRSEDALDEEPT